MRWWWWWWCLGGDAWKKKKTTKSKRERERKARDEEKREHAEKTLVSRKLDTSVRKTVGKLRGGGESGDEVAGIYDG